MNKEQVMKAFEEYADPKYVTAVKDRMEAGYRWMFDSEFDNVAYLVDTDDDVIIVLEFNEVGLIVNSEFKEKL